MYIRTHVYVVMFSDFQDEIRIVVVCPFLLPHNTTTTATKEQLLLQQQEKQQLLLQQ